MSDETPVTPQNETPASEPAAAPSPDEQRLERSTERLERLTGAEQPEAAPEPVAARPQAPPEPRGEHPLTKQWRERVRARAERDALRKIEQRLDSIVPAAAPQEAAPAAPATPEDPEPKSDDFRDDWSYQQAWIAWNGRQQEQRILAAMEKQIGPVAEQVKRAHETQAQYEERVAIEREVAAEHQRHRELAVYSEQEYTATPEGEGYYDRFIWHFGHPGAPEQGVPPIDGVFTQALVDAGFPVQEARRANWLNVQALNSIALGYNIPPAVLIDSFNRRMLSSAAEFLGVKPNGHAAAAETPPPAPRVHPAARKGQKEIQQLQEAAAAAAPAAGSLRDGASGKPQAINFKALAGKGKEAVQQALEAKYGKNWKAGLREMRRAVNEMRQMGT